MVGSHFQILLKRYTVGLIYEFFEQPILLFASFVLTEMLRLVGFSIQVRDAKRTRSYLKSIETLRSASKIDLALTE
ncbi:hypothetical protein COO91_05556 [Nostoc flagelliforme CCNUN1]|uniref:Uncharacterized protein n=1 Tax=Nostoc flagelliforme CCNUN1 TaxID=2038116 RepID=A0A2K8SW27_9NOSO|nr:hypothetical protein COO91_05556 [Nostoc flagelliforme CCNUN1]